eukprot:TRINITY_DN37325_c0_g1_i1.p2 TRINITY_DN37325_c0_g1~~TRINITY_DN37325_c0_g1_i1.p2  ORF type:complete len:184 (+),score=83.89 TRINITY_DN37325_c0_g1_i1:71-553(+)
MAAVAVLRQQLDALNRRAAEQQLEREGLQAALGACGGGGLDRVLAAAEAAQRRAAAAGAAAAALRGEQSQLLSALAEAGQAAEEERLLSEVEAECAQLAAQVTLLHQEQRLGALQHSPRAARAGGSEARAEAARLRERIAARGLQVAALEKLLYDGTRHH